MSANPYDPVTTTDSTYLADDDWGLTLPPLRYNKSSGMTRLKSACFEIKQHPKCLAISLVVLGCMLLLTIIITVASNSHHEPAKRTGNEPKWAKTEKGLEFYPVPEDGTIVVTFDPEKFYHTAEQPIERNLNKQIKPYRTTSQLGDMYTDCNGTYSPPDKVCRIASSSFGDACSNFNHFGYYNGQPCILMQLVLPETLKIAPITKGSPLWDYEQEASEDKMPYDENNVQITCQGKTGTDSKVLGGLSLYKHRFEYFPKQGFPAYVYRPRMASLPHLRPAVMVQVMSLLDGQIAHVTCTVWGQLYDFSDKLVSHDLLKTNFAVYIDR